MDNINFNNTAWTSIVWEEDYHANSFNFDGNGKTIMNVKNAKEGLFGQFYNNGSKCYSSVNVENLTLQKVEISNSSDDIWVGAVIAGSYGDIDNVKLIDCKVSNSTDDARIGGIVGFWNGGSITNCQVENTTVAGGKAAGGICGTIAGDAYGTWSGNTVTDNVYVSVNLESQATASKLVGVNLSTITVQ